MTFRQFALFSVILLLVFSCRDDDEEENFGISIKPVDNYIVRERGGSVGFTVSIQSVENLSRYRITESINNQSTNTIKEESISGRVYSDWFDYTVPDTLGYGNHAIKIIFSTLDAGGKEMQRAKIIRVNVPDRTLTEYGGNTMYSSISAEYDAFNLLKGMPLYSSDSEAHVIDMTRSNPGDTLSKSWSSPNPEIKFVRFNNFDYGNATDQSVKTAYEAGVKKFTITNLKADDILLSKIGDRYVAVRLIYVMDEAGKLNDRYIFSIKR